MEIPQGSLQSLTPSPFPFSRAVVDWPSLSAAAAVRFPDGTVMDRKPAGPAAASAAASPHLSTVRFWDEGDP